MPTLGPFDLEAPIASGGMGAVWLARHRQTSLPVAVKFIRTDRAHARALAERIEHEARTLAALSHPRIVALVDWGRTPPAAADALGLAEGSPYLVLEYASGGDLQRHAASMMWTDLRRVLLGLLDALAHAHARGVVHLDLKPANVMRVAHGGASLEVKLGDFGIARRTDAPGYASRLVAGTPGFIAPEVAAGAWRRVGPWSDLFALSAFARFLLARDALVPDGFEAWLAQVGAPSVTRRTLHAAHAAAALNALGEAVRPFDPRAPRAEEATWFWDEPSSPLPAAIPSRARVARSLPASWRPDVMLLPRRDLPDAGQATLALRRPTLTGREPEQDALWQALRASEHGPRLVWIHGDPGMGAEAVSEWLDLRATELGAAVPLATRFAEGETLHDALRRAIASWLRVHDLDPDGAADAAQGWTELYAMDEGEAAALEALARWCVGPSAPAPVEALHEVLRCFSARSVVLVRLDDADRAQGGFLELDPLVRDPSLRLLVVVTTRTRDAAPWTILSGWMPSSTLTLGPLTSRQVASALSSVATLEPGTASALAERAAGRPGAAFRELRAHHARGALVASPDGLLIGDVDPPRPEVSPAAHARWLEDRGMLGEAGAYWLLAGDLDQAAAALMAGLRSATPLSETGPAMPWVHLLEKVVARAPWPESDPRRGEPALWRTTMLLGASRYAEAYAAGSRLLEKAREAGWSLLIPRIQQVLGRSAMYRGEVDAAHAHLESARRGAEAAGDALTHGRAEVDLGRLILARGDVDAAHALVRSGRERIVGQNARAADLSHMILADIAIRRGLPDEAQGWCDKLAQERSPRDIALVVLRASLHQLRGDADAAIRSYRRAAADLGPDDSVEYAIVMVNLAMLLVARGENAEAIGLLERAVVGYRVAGRRPLEAFCHGILLEALGANGDHPAFVRHLHEAEALLASTGFCHPELEESLARTATLARGLGWPEADRVDRLATPPPAGSCT